MADLANLKPSERTIEIRDPKTDEAIGVSVTIMSQNDDRLKGYKRRVNDKAIKLEQRGKSFNAEEREQNGDGFLTAAMTGWTWGIDPRDGTEAVFNGEKPEFNAANIKKVFTEIPWFKSQIDEAVADDKAFF